MTNSKYDIENNSYDNRNKEKFNFIEIQKTKKMRIGKTQAYSEKL